MISTRRAQVLLNLTTADCPHPERISGLSVFLWKSILYGAFVWAHRALNRPKRPFLARAVGPAALAADFVHRAAGGARSQGDTATLRCHWLALPAIPLGLTQ
jgi:hypothetical protein